MVQFAVNLSLYWTDQRELRNLAVRTVDFVAEFRTMYIPNYSLYYRLMMVLISRNL
jgi:hypothetical protein